VDTSQHDNEFDLYLGQGVTSLAYVASGAYSITTDQASTWDGVTAVMAGSSSSPYLQINAEAGRHASAEVSQWFFQQAPLYTCVWANSACTLYVSSNNPGSLNFAFTGTLTINGTGYAITIGQGSDGTNNYWFFGEQYWTAGGTYGTIVTPDGRYAIHGKGTYSATVSAA
jgi:hypothetical protein